MSSSFSQLKKSSNSSLGDLSKKLDSLNESQKSNFGPDERFWKLTVDKSQNGHAIIRFLPASNGESVPWVRMFSHGFKGPGGWYIEKSLTTIGQKDPVSEYNTKLWNSGIDSNKAIARDQKRKLQYVSNIYVVSDTANPDNEGKVFLFQYGKKIFDKLNDMMHPEFEDETPVNPFDLWKGANFRLRARKVDGYRNYDKSEFDSVTSLIEDNDEEMERVWNSQYSLEELVALDQFKTYSELKTRFERVIGVNGVSAVDENLLDSIGASESASSDYREPAASVDADDDESMSYFKKLADDI